MLYICDLCHGPRSHSGSHLWKLLSPGFRNGRLLGVCASVDNCRLFVGGIPKTKKREEILSEMKKVTEGVVDVIVYPSAADKTKNRGFAFVEYESHRAAAMARRRLLPGEPRSQTGTPNPQQTLACASLLPLSFSSCLFLSQMIRFHKVFIDVLESYTSSGELWSIAILQRILGEETF